MAIDENEPLHQYEEEPELIEEDRLQRIMDLKQSIEEGTYNVDQQLDSLIGNIRARLSGASDSNDDAPDEA